MGRKGLPIPEVKFVPHHFYPLLRVHGQKGALDPRHVPLVHLGGKDVCVLIRIDPGCGCGLYHNLFPTMNVLLALPSSVRELRR